MLNIYFEINGRRVDSNNIEDAFEAAMLQAIEQQVRSKLQGVRDPDTGAFPVVAVVGSSLENLSFRVSGSPKLIALVNAAFGDASALEQAPMVEQSRTPCAFLCHSTKNTELVRKLATDLQSKHIDTFWSEWEIEPGDSLRQKIDEGLERCTHFICVLTPESIDAPWVKTEMDAGFVRKVSGKCKFIALRRGVDVSSLPATIQGYLSPDITDYESAVAKLINSIHGIAEKPPLGPAPRTLKERSSRPTGLSPAAELIAKAMIERSEHGDSFDPQLDVAELRALGDFSDDDIVDAVDELAGRGLVRKHLLMGPESFDDFTYISAEARLFCEYDKYFKEWDPAEDALRLAADLLNRGDDRSIADMATEFGWAPRRMNPAVMYLVIHGALKYDEVAGAGPWCGHWVTKTAATRRFVQART